MSDDYQQSQRIKKVKRDAHYHNHYHEAPLQPTAPPSRPSFRRWGVVGVGASVVLGLGAGGYMHLNAEPVYYCASHNTVKYHTNATCPALRHCGARVKSMPLGQAKGKMDLCRACH